MFYHFQCRSVSPWLSLFQVLYSFWSYYNGIVFLISVLKLFDHLCWWSLIESLVIESMITLGLCYGLIFMYVYMYIYMYVYIYMLCCAYLLSHVWLMANPWPVACQAPLSMGFSRQEYWGWLPCPPPGDLPIQGLNPGLPHCRWFFTTSATREAQEYRLG